MLQKCKYFCYHSLLLVKWKGDWELLGSLNWSEKFELRSPDTLGVWLSTHSGGFSVFLVSTWSCFGGPHSISVISIFGTCHYSHRVEEPAVMAGMDLELLQSAGKPPVCLQPVTFIVWPEPGLRHASPEDHTLWLTVFVQLTLNS